MSEGRIPILDLGPEIDALWSDLNAAIQGVLRSAQFINGPEVKLFEREVASYLEAKHAVPMNSGTDALVIGLRALGIKSGDEVITTPFTFFATAEAISILGAVPVFVDIEPRTFNLDARKLEAAVTPRTKAIIPVHLFGHAAAMSEIMATAQRHGLKILEDVAQAFGGEYRGKKLGTIGDAGAFSFFPSKNLGAYGDGGLLTASDEGVADLARMLSTHGSKKKYFNETVGYNSRLDTLQAAILRTKLPHIDAAAEGRRHAARRYNELLSGDDRLVLPVEEPFVRHVFHQYTVRVLDGRRDAVKESLSRAGIDTMVYYPTPVHRLPVYSHLRLQLPEAERAAAEVLSLPLWPQIDISTQERVVLALRSALRG